MGKEWLWAAPFSIHDRRSIHSLRRNGLEMAVGVRGAEWLPDSSSQAPLNDGKDGFERTIPQSLSATAPFT